MATPNTFEGARLDRVTARRRDAGWVAERLADPESRAVVLAETAVLVEDDSALALVELPPLLERWRRTAAARRAGRPRAVRGRRRHAGLEALAPAELVSVRDIAPRLAQDEGGLIAYAASLLNWHRRHRFCSVCGNPSLIEEAGLLRRCPACGSEHHPRTDPVVIMLVVDEQRDRVLLGRQPSWPPGRYSALAGFVEPGESLEDAVAREVLEESGVEVGRRPL